MKQVLDIYTAPYMDLLAVSVVKVIEAAERPDPLLPMSMKLIPVSWYILPPLTNVSKVV